MFIVLLEYPDPSATEQFREGHVAHVRRHAQSGHLLLSGPKRQRTGGAMVVKADTFTEVEAIVAQDPYKVNGVANYQIIEFTPVLGVLTELLESSPSS